MFEEFRGIPLHPLLVHAAVVFVPLFVASVIGYALVPRLRAFLGWLTAALAVVAPLAALFSKLSGDAFRARLVHRGLRPGDLLGKIDAHRHFGTYTVWFTAAAAVVTLVMLYLRRMEGGSKALDLTLRVVAVVLSLVAAYYVIRTGDSGAHIVWQNS
jgi:hypothetical protein